MWPARTSSELPARAWRWIAPSLVGLLGACDGSAPAPVAPPPSVAPPDAGGCTPGERIVDGACVPAGIPPSECGPGFEPDDASGCRVVLPAEPCPEGLMAVPGETMCREVAPCAGGTWGDIPVDADTQHVDAAHAGDPSDGSAARPWTTIQVAIDAASPNALVAIASGVYVEDLVVAKPVRIWGRCPGLVEISGAGATSAVFIGEGAVGAEVHTVAVTGPGEGVAVTGAEDVLLDRVWVHGTGLFGIDLVSAFGATAARVEGVLVERAQSGALMVQGADAQVSGAVFRETLVGGGVASGIYAVHGAGAGGRSTLDLEGSVLERNQGHGLFVEGSDATLEATVVRDTDGSASSPGLSGRGVAVQADAGSDERGGLTVRTSLIERNRDTGVYCSACDLDIETTVVRDTAPRASDMMFGYGINAQLNSAGARAKVAIRASVVANNRGTGVRVAASDATFDGIVARETAPNAAADGAARGIDVVHDGGAARSVVAITGSLVSFNHGHGMLLQASDVTISGTAVRDTLSAADGALGRGIEINDGSESFMRANVTVAASAVERCFEVGIVVFGSDATIEGSSVVDVAPSANDQRFGRCIDVESSAATQQGGVLTLRDSRVGACRQAGVSVTDSVAMLERVVVEDVRADAAGMFGDGVSVAVAKLPTASATILGSRIEGSARAGVTSFGASVSLGSTALECNPVPLDAEPWAGASPTFVDLGENVCGCKGQAQDCKVISAALEPPSALGDPMP